MKQILDLRDVDKNIGDIHWVAAIPKSFVSYKEVLSFHDEDGNCVLQLTKEEAACLQQILDHWLRTEELFDPNPMVRCECGWNGYKADLWYPNGVVEDLGRLDEILSCPGCMEAGKWSVVETT